MIEKNNNIDELYSIFKEYKENYKPIINEFTNIYTYKIDNNVVAFLIFNIMYEKCEIIDIFVIDEYRRKHIAELLITNMLDDYTVENVTLEVSTKNISAIKLYEKLGFKVVATRKNYYKDSDGLLMLREIR